MDDEQGGPPDRGSVALLDRLAVADVIQRERLARDARDWDRMAACWHQDSSVDISWFKGRGRDFVARSRANAREGSLNFHVLQPMAIEIAGSRAIADMPCTLRSFSVMEGVEVSIEGFTRLLWRARRSDEGWLIAGLRVVYVRDMLLACDPARAPILDQDRLAKLRPSYRYLAYHLQQEGLTPRDDLPGTDCPELVTALVDGERRWLAEG